MGTIPIWGLWRYTKINITDGDQRKNFHPGLIYWDMFRSSREKEEKRGKPETQGEWKMSPYIETSECSPKKHPML